MKNKLSLIGFLFILSWAAALFFSLFFILSRMENTRLKSRAGVLEQNIISLSKEIERNNQLRSEKEKLEKKIIDYLQWQFVVREQVNQANSRLKEQINKIKDLKKNNDLRGLLYYNLGLACILAVDFDSAINAFEQAVKFNPKDADSYYNLGLLYSTYKQDTKEALKQYKKYIEISPLGAKAENVKERINSLEDK